MQVNTESTTSTSTTLIITVSEKEMTQTKEEIERKLTAKVKLPGFRSGKAPLHLAVKEINQQSLYEAFLTDFVPRAAQQAIDLKEIRPVIPPDISITKFVPFKDLEVTVKAEHLGDIQLDDYKKMSEKIPDIKVSAAEVKKVLERVRYDFATYKDVSRAGRDGDRIWIDFEGFDKGKPIAGASGQDYPLILGSQTFIPGFEEELIGSRKGQNKDFKLKFPKDYKAGNLAGREVNFKVFVRKIEQVDLPVLDAALALKVGPFKTLAELKKFVKKQILEDKKKQAKSLLQGQIVAKLSAQSVIEVPKGLIKLEIDKINEEHQNYLKENRLSLEEWLKDMKLDLKAHEEKLELVALNRLKGGIVLREVALKEKIEIDQAEIDQNFARRGGDSLNPQRAIDLKRDIRAHLLTQKTLNKLAEIVISDSK